MLQAAQCRQAILSPALVPDGPKPGTKMADHDSTLWPCLSNVQTASSERTHSTSNRSTASSSTCTDQRLVPLPPKWVAAPA